MSAPQYRIPPKFLALLHERGLYVFNVATQAGLGVSVTQKALANHPRTGQRHRAQLAAVLNEPELKALGWTKAGELFPVEQFSPCSTAPSLSETT